MRGPETNKKLPLAMRALLGGKKMCAHSDESTFIRESMKATDKRCDNAILFEVWS
jgi:hypothetical protein